MKFVVNLKSRFLQPIGVTHRGLPTEAMLKVLLSPPYPMESYDQKWDL